MSWPATRSSPWTPGERHANAGRQGQAGDEEPGYNQRRDECQRACELLSITSLRDATLDDGRAAARSRSPIAPATSSPRTSGCATRSTALHDGDLPRVGELLNASHASLRDCFAVSTPAVEATVQRLLDAGAIGARIVGGGFGGHVLGLFGPGGRPPEGRA